MSDKLQGGGTSVTAFIAGATGYTGHALVRELRHQGARVIAHVRPDSRRLAEWQARFTAYGAEVDATPWAESAIAARLEALQPDLVFALLGTTRARRRTAQGAHDSYDAVDYGLSALLLRATRRSAPRARFSYLSSAGVGPDGRGDYLRVRWRLEQELRASGLDYVIARPSFITGPDREEQRPAERVGAAVTDAMLAVAGLLGLRRLRARYRSRTATELARALAYHAQHAASGGRVLHGDDLFAAPSLAGTGVAE